MSTTKILVTGRHPEIMATIIRLINNKPEWQGTGALTQEEAITAFTNEAFDLVLIGAGLTPEEKEAFTAFCRSERPLVPVIQHYGGGSGLLFGEIYQALGR